jgi:hypothetical protein
MVKVIQNIGIERFGYDHGKMMHVYLDVEPKKVLDGISEIQVYGLDCRLYKWMAQEYHRGLIVLAEDTWSNQVAHVYMESRTWSWILDEEDKRKLPVKC